MASFPMLIFGFASAIRTACAAVSDVDEHTIEALQCDDAVYATAFKYASVFALWCCGEKYLRRIKELVLTNRPSRAPSYMRIIRWVHEKSH